MMKKSKCGECQVIVLLRVIEQDARVNDTRADMTSVMQLATNGNLLTTV